MKDSMTKHLTELWEFAEFVLKKNNQTLKTPKPHFNSKTEDSDVSDYGLSLAKEFRPYVDSPDFKQWTEEWSDKRKSDPRLIYAKWKGFILLCFRTESAIEIMRKYYTKE